MKTRAISLPYPALELVPHRPPVLFIRELLERQEESSVSSGLVPAASIFAYTDKKGTMPELFVEIIAQAMAAISGYDALKAARPPQRGFLVGIDDFHFPGRLLPDELFTVSLSKVIEFGGVTIMNGILRQEGIVAQGMLKVWVEDETNDTL